MANDPSADVHEDSQQPDTIEITGSGGIVLPSISTKDDK